MAWKLYELSIDLVKLVAPVAEAVDAGLADQLRRAVASVPLNLAEGSGRAGRDRVRCYRIALGSARELRAALTIAGLLYGADIAASDGLADRVCAILWRTIRPA